jgi:hypothetical protein
MPKLFDLNGISRKDMMLGKDEADTFRKGELNTVFMSTLSKVGGIGTVLELEMDGKLKTKKHPIVEKIADAHESSAFKIAEIILALLGVIQLPLTVMNFLQNK